MENRSSSRAQVASDDTTSLRSSTTVPPKRPVTKPIAPRLASSTNTTRPTVTSRASTTTTPSSLSKPPARPTVASTTRRPASTIGSSTLHRPRPSTASVEASGDESGRDEIAAKPKRMSLASSINTASADRVPPARVGAATPVRRTPTAPTSTTTTTRPSTTTSARTTSTLSARAQPPSSAGTRTATGLADKKRLSTIPASPVVKGSLKSSSEKASNDGTVGDSKRPIRPVLGSRMSTRSILLEQRIHEFELVNQMLQSAMAADGMNSKEQENVNNEAKGTIAKLRTDLAKIRAFEKEYGRVPNETELADMDDMPEEAIEELEQEVVEEKPKATEEELSAIRKAHAAQLEGNLAEYQMKVDELEAATAEAEALAAKHLAETTALAETNAMELAERDAEIESLRDNLKSLTDGSSSNLLVKEAELESLRSELEQAQESSATRSSSKDTEIEELKNELKRLNSEHSKELATKVAELETLQANVDTINEERSAGLTAKEAELATLKGQISVLEDHKATEIAAKDAEVEVLRAEVEILRKRPVSTASNSPDLTRQTSASPSRDQELLDVQQQLEAARVRHAQAKDNAKAKIAKEKEQYATKLAELEEQHKTKVIELQGKVDASEQETARIRAEIDSMAASQEQFAKEHGSLQKSHEDSTSRYRQVINKLETELEGLKAAHATMQTASSETIDKLKDEHVAKVNDIKTQLQSAQAELKSVTNTKNQANLELVEKLQTDLDAARQELKSATTSHEESLGTLEAELHESTRVLEEAHSLHEKELSTLRAEIAEANKSRDDDKTIQTERLRDLERQLANKHDELEALENDHAQEMTRVRAEAEATRRKALAELKKHHADQLHQLEEQSKSVLQDLESLETSNISQIEQVKNEAAATQQKALDEMSQTHAEAVKTFESQLASYQEELVTTKTNFDEQVSELKKEHTADKDSSLATLSAEHEKKISEINALSLSVHESELSELKERHAEQLRQLEGQSRESASAVDAAKFQIQTLKSILQDVENESKQKEEEHEKAMEKLDSDFSKAVMNISQKSSHIAMLQSQHAIELEQAKSEATTKNKAELDGLKKVHEQALESVRDGLEASHKTRIESLQAEHMKALEVLKSDQESQGANVEALKIDHARELTELRSELDTRDVAMNNTVAEHTKAMNDLQNDLEAKHSATIKESQRSHQSVLEETSKQLSDSLETIKAEHKGVVTELQQELDSLRLRSQDTSELDALKTKLTDSQRSVEQLREAQAEMMANISKTHEEEIAKLQAELTVLRAESEKPVDTPEVDGLRSQLREAQDHHSSLAAQHVEALSTKNREHEQALITLRSELEGIKSAKQESEETRNLLADAKRTITDLNEQYANALLEAELQRQIADKAERDQRELAELKKALTQVESNGSNTVPFQKIKTNNTNGDTRSKGSPKPGLKASRWATESEEAADAEAEAVVETPAQSSNHTDQPKKRNVAGQMAGIAESIRQLDEMSAGFLEENQRMARTLSRVEDDGTLTIGKD